MLLGKAATAHRRSIIFRREAKQGRSLIDYAREVFGANGRFNENSGIWRGLPGGRQIEFAGVKDPSDVYNWRGQPHDFCGFDEADAFLESQVRFLLGWLRTTVVGQKCQAVLCFNPPATATGRWLLSFFGPWIDRKHPNPAAPGELRWYVTVKGGREIECPNGESFENQGEIVTPTSRTFFPASVNDNPYLLATDYVTRLQSLPEPLRSQLLYGDMAAGLEDDPWQVIPTAWIEAAMRRWRPEVDVRDMPLSAVGVDPARGGKDRTAIAPRRRTWFGPVEIHPGTATPDGDFVAGLIQQTILRSGSELDLRAVVNVDGIGVGAAVVDACRRLNLRTAPVIFSERAMGMDRAGVLHFANLRAYAYWSLRDALDPVNGDDLALPPDQELLADLAAPKWENRASGVLLEPKEKLSERIGRSPDKGDAVVMAHLNLGCGDMPEVVKSEREIGNIYDRSHTRARSRLFGR